MEYNAIQKNYAAELSDYQWNTECNVAQLQYREDPGAVKGDWLHLALYLYNPPSPSPTLPSPLSPSCA